MVEIDQKQQLPTPPRNSHSNSFGNDLSNSSGNDLAAERLGTGEGVLHLETPAEIGSVIDSVPSALDIEQDLHLTSGNELEEFNFPVEPAGPGLLSLGSSRHYSPIERLGLNPYDLAAELDRSRLGEPVLNHMRASVGRSYAIEAPPEVAERLGTQEVQVHVSKLPHSNGQDCLYKVTVVAQQDTEPGLNPLSGRTTVGSFVVDHRGQQPEVDRMLPVAARNIRNDFNAHANDAELAYWLPKVMSA